MNKKRKIILAVIIILLVVVSYFGYKEYNLYKYTLHYDGDDANFKITDTIKVDSNIADDYLSFDEVSFKNDFSDFDKSDIHGDIVAGYILKDKEGKVNKSFSYIKTDEKVDVLRKLEETDGFNINKKDNQKILDKNNIKNDLDLIKYLSENDLAKSNIFTSLSDMKENYFFNYVKIIELPEINGITLIEGDYSGYILNDDNIKEVHILKNDKNYVFLFIGSEYTDEYIEEFLNTLVIK